MSSQPLPTCTTPRFHSLFLFITFASASVTLPRSWLFSFSPVNALHTLHFSAFMSFISAFMLTFSLPLFALTDHLTFSPRHLQTIWRELHHVPFTFCISLFTRWCLIFFYLLPTFRFTFLSTYRSIDLYTYIFPNDQYVIWQHFAIYITSRVDTIFFRKSNFYLFNRCLEKYRHTGQEERNSPCIVRLLWQ